MKRNLSSNQNAIRIEALDDAGKGCECDLGRQQENMKHFIFVIIQVINMTAG